MVIDNYLGGYSSIYKILVLGTLSLGFDNKDPIGPTVASLLATIIR